MSDNDRAEEILDLADAIRELMDAFVGTSAPLEVFDGAAGDVRAVAARLAGHPQDALYLGYAEAAIAGQAAGDASLQGRFDNSPLMGRANPLAPPLRLVMHDDRVTGEVHFGAAYEGPPGHVHGGFVAAAFDELLGLTQSLSGTPGMTGRLIVHYRKPTPLHTDLRLEGTLDRVEGRKNFCSGRLYAGDLLCAESEGLFVRLDPERFAQMRAAVTRGGDEAS